MADLAPRMHRTADGAIALALTRRERTIIRALVDDLRALVGDASLPPGLTEDADEELRAGDVAEGVPSEPDTPEASLEPAEADRDPVRRRLYPDARPDDPAWSARFRDLVRPDLDDARRSNLAVVEATLDAPTIDDAQADAWLHVLNDVRLVLGTRLEVTDETPVEALDDDDPDAARKVVYAYTGWLEAQLIDVLAAALPDVADGAPGAPRSDDDESVSADDS